jgi:electron transport complex protein RnfE
MNSLTQEFMKGVIKENPLLRLLLGMCPTLAVTTTATNGLGMGVAAMFVMVGANIVISALRNVTPTKVRIPVFVITIATFVSLVDMVIAAYVPTLYDALGIFIPLIVVNCVVFSRVEAFARKNPVGLSIADALGMGVGYGIMLVLMGSIRELFGAGSIFGVSLLGASFQPMLIFASPPGAFITLGVVIGIANYIFKRFKIA